MALFDELKTPPALMVSSTAVEVPSPLSSPIEGHMPPASPVFEDMGNSPFVLCFTSYHGRSHSPREWLRRKYCR